VTPLAGGGAAREQAARAIDGPGTPEEDWTGVPGLRDLPVVRLPEGPVLVVAAHPDDEVLGLGGTLAELAGAGTPVHVLSVTDGEGSHPRSDRPSARTLAEVRTAELRDALGELGLPDVLPRRLRVPDTQVDRYEEDVRESIVAALRETGSRVCAAPWAHDLHSDHEAAGRAAAAACAATGATLLSYPVWLWHWARPGDPRVPWHRAGRLPLSRTAAAAKRRAVERFVSQIRPIGPGPDDAAILPPDELAHHTRGFEVVFR
jgi:LmbE family N-acetylglucosaminyl deacetylase